MTAHTRSALAAVATRLALALATAAALAPAPAAAQAYDLVLRGGRVMDPESGLDAVRDVGLRDGRIAAVSDSKLAGREIIDVTGLVVAPGFVDLHAHGQDPFSAALQARDGVTTALELEGGASPVEEWYASREGKAIINYGASVGHIATRIAVVGGAPAGDLLTGERTPEQQEARRRGTYEAATAEQLRELTRRMEQGLDEGAIGFGFGINYVPGAEPSEVAGLFAAAARRGVAVFVHTRDFGIPAIEEVIGHAERTGAALHIVHIGSSTTRQVDRALGLIDEARARGVDVTTEVYPYTAASTSLQSAIFDEGFREKLGIDYGDLEWVATQERLTEESFRRYRAEGGIVIIHMIPEATVETALRHPGVIVASDGVTFVDGRAHPRGAGTFARVLGRYVREKRVLPLMDALARMTYLPARRLEAFVPAMRDKGRIRVGADADITVFDPATVIDRATFPEPAQGSAGIPYVIVGGTLVVRDGELVEGTLPGRPVRSGR